MSVVHQKQIWCECDCACYYRYVANMLYLGVTSSILSMFVCKKLGDSDLYYLIARPTIECYDSSHTMLTVTSERQLQLYLSCLTVSILSVARDNWSLHLGTRLALRHRCHFVRCPAMSAGCFSLIVDVSQLHWKSAKLATGSGL